MTKYIVVTTLLGTDTGSQPVSIPVEATTGSGALTIARRKLDKIVSEGKASGYTAPRVKIADVQKP
jgi:hypothetical protein